MPDLSSFPRGDWAWAVHEACGAVPSADLGYGDPRGSAVLREVLAGYLRRVRAAAADPALMVVSTGFAQGVNLVLRALASQAGVGVVAFEDPGSAAPRPTRRSARCSRWACGSCPSPSTTTAWWSASWPPAGRGRW